MIKRYKLLLVLFLFGLNISFAQTTLTRGPYLQMGNQTGVTVRWRTAAATNSRITWGTAFGTYPNTINDATVTTEHELRINGLLPDTKYFYTVGSSTQTLEATNLNYVLTLPPANTTRKLRFLALGDCGNASTNQIDVKNAALNYLGTNDLDAVLTIGDNAYSSGLDNEFQLEFFNIYNNDILKNKKLYMVPGNHDYGNSSSNTGVRSNAYYNNFTLPTAAELGGTASGTEAYYSYDIGDVHFVALDSYGRENGNTTKLYDTTGAQCVWLKNDLTVNTKKWTVVYFHHPPYTKTSHSSDYNSGTGELDLVAVREKFVRILERFGVDIVLCGHSHGYERSYLLKNYYNTYASPLEDATFNIATHTATGNNQNAKYDGTANSCAYTYNSGRYNHGSIYVVAGSSGQLGGTSTGYPHNAMYYSNVTNGGSFYIEVDSNRLDAKFLSYSGTGGSVTPVIRDQFTIFKDVKKVNNISVAVNDIVNLSASWKWGTYYWPNNGGVTTRSVTVNTTIPGTYDFVVKDNAVTYCLQDSFHVEVTGALPVYLSNYTVVADNNKVLLNWVTAQEINNKHFTIEKSIDGISFKVLGIVLANSNSGAGSAYKFIDYLPVEGINYYRLSQTNNDGSTSYFAVKTITYKASKNISVSIFNIEKEKIKVAISSTKNDNVKLRIVDILGKEILQQNFSITTGSNSKIIQLKSGFYIVIITDSNGEQICNKVIVQ